MATAHTDLCWWLPAEAVAAGLAVFPVGDLVSVTVAGAEKEYRRGRINIIPDVSIKHDVQ
jgi:hypothetical protein